MSDAKRVATVCYCHAGFLVKRLIPGQTKFGTGCPLDKLMAFVLSTTICGLGGATKAIVFQLASLTDVTSGTSGEAVLMTLVGGLGTLLGPIVGAFVITGMETYLAEWGQWVTVIQGVVFVVCVMAFRRGLVGEIAYRTGKPL